MKSKNNDLLIQISRETGESISSVQKILKSYSNFQKKELGDICDMPEPLLSGIFPIDAMIRIHPGISIIYSRDDLGKTSVLKRIAKALYSQGKNVIYMDAEHKLYMNDLEELSGVYLTYPDKVEAVKELAALGHIDVLIVDTISSMPSNTLKAFIFTMRKYVPFLIFSAQMRVDINTRKSVPACSDSILSTAHTHIYLTESEKIRFEEFTMRRVQFSIMKYEVDYNVRRDKSSFVIYNNIVHNEWSSIDLLHAIGRIRSYGQNKLYDDIDIGKYKDIYTNNEMMDILIMEASSELSKNPVKKEVIDVYRGNRVLQQVRPESDETITGHSSADREELVCSDIN